jgi:hypothetical protein
LQIVLALRDGPELAIINLDAAEQADHRLRAASGHVATPL